MDQDIHNIGCFNHTWDFLTDLWAKFNQSLLEMYTDDNNNDNDVEVIIQVSSRLIVKQIHTKTTNEYVDQILDNWFIPTDINNYVVSENLLNYLNIPRDNVWRIRFNLKNGRMVPTGYIFK